MLNESDLDTSYLHNFYLSQEYADSFNEVINNALVNVATGAGIVETETDEVIAALVNKMLEDANAANLQARITDIDANAEAIITLGEGLQIQITTLAEGVAATIYIQPGEPIPGVGGVPDPIPNGARWYDSDDDNRPYIYLLATLEWVSTEDPRVGVLVTDLDVLEAVVSDGSTGLAAAHAAVVTEATARATQDTAIATTLALIGAEVDAGAAFLLDLNTVKVGAAETLASRFSTITADWTAADVTAVGDAATYTDAEITTEQTVRANADGAFADTFTLMGAENAGGTAFILDENTVKIASDGGDTVAERFTGIAADINGNSGSITTIQTVTIPGVETTVTTAQTAADNAQSYGEGVAGDLTAFEGDVQVEYGVDLTANGYVSGFRLINGGTPGASAFVILADKFAIVDPSGDPAETEYVPMQIVGGKVRFNANVEIDGNLMVSGTINGQTALSATYPLGSTLIGPNAITTTQLNANAVTAAKINANEISATHIVGSQLDVLATNTGTLFVDESLTMSAAGHMKGGQTAYNTGTGFWIGYDSADYKFSIGNGTNYLTWDGTELQIKGDLIVGTYVSSDNIILSATTERSDWGSDGGFETYKTFTVAKDGIVKLSVDYKCGTFSGGVIDACQWQVTVNSVQKSIWGSSTQTSYLTNDIALTGLVAGDVIDINMIGGLRNPIEPIEVFAWIRNAYIKADVVIAPGGTVDLD